jgi:hypothetical protein
VVIVRGAWTDEHIMTMPETPDEEDGGAAVTPELYIVVTDADIRAAMSTWWAATVAEASAARLTGLWRDFEQVMRTQAQQVGEQIPRQRSRTGLSYF